MKYIFFLLFICSCQQSNDKLPVSPFDREDISSTPGSSYDEIKDSIIITRKKLHAKYSPLAGNEDEITNFWVEKISNDLYSKWKNTPWDFNGTAVRPGNDPIACGFFVTTILRDMDFKIDRTKLAICPSSLMMKSLAPHQKFSNLSNKSYNDFNEALKKMGKGVYIIGLDFHTGFIINDGKENWFIHSNYINRKGVTKEAVSSSAALRASKTRWLISLTGDKDFLNRWLKG